MLDSPFASGENAASGAAISLGIRSSSVASPSPVSTAPAPACRYGSGSSLASDPEAITLAPWCRAARIIPHAAPRMAARHILLRKL